MKQILSGKKAICGFMGMGWPKLERWIIERGFPAKKIDGVWESDSELITAWRQKQISANEEMPQKSQPIQPKTLKKRRKSLSR